MAVITQSITYPLDNLTHILYGFIPICGPNESVKSVGGNSYNALKDSVCQGVNDYEVELATK